MISIWTANELSEYCTWYLLCRGFLRTTFAFKTAFVLKLAKNLACVDMFQSAGNLTDTIQCSV